MISPNQEQKIASRRPRSIRDMKEYAQKLPEPVKTLILSSPDEMTEDEFLSKFVEWRKLIRMQTQKER